MSDVERQAVIGRGKGDGGILGEEEDIAGAGDGLLARGVLDCVVSLEDDLHLVVLVGVGQGSALLESEEARRDGLFGVGLVAGEDIAEEGVLVGEEGNLELGLSLSVVFHGSHCDVGCVLFVGNGEFVGVIERLQCVFVDLCV